MNVFDYMARNIADQMRETIFSPSDEEAVRGKTAIVEMGADETPKLFRKYTIKSGEKIPKELNLNGCVGITRDTKCDTFIHGLINCVELFNSAIFKEEVDSNLMHAFFTLGCDREKNSFYVAHSDFPKVLREERNYLSEKDVTEVVIYEPIDQKVREIIVKNLFTASPDPIGADGRKAPKPSYAPLDAFMATFSDTKARNIWHQLRMPLAVSDLLQESYLLDEFGNPHDFICSAYSMTLLQAALLINELSEEERERLLGGGENRYEIADKVFKVLNGKPVEGLESLQKACTKIQFLQLNGRFTLPSQLGRELDRVSETATPPLR